MKSKLIAVIVATCAVLTGCSLLTPVKNERGSTYELSAVPDITPAKHSRKINLMVAQPEISSAYNTHQIAYTTKPFTIDYYSRNQWAETPSEMLHPLIVETLQDANYFHAVVTPPFSGHSDYLLTTQINKLQIDMLTKPAHVHLSLRLQLIKLANNQIIATKNIYIEESMEGDTPYAGVLAANKATEKALQKIVNFCMVNIK
jgi:cholesterol transport system auxiliary component